MHSVLIISILPTEVNPYPLFISILHPYKSNIIYIYIYIIYITQQKKRTLGIRIRFDLQ